MTGLEFQEHHFTWELKDNFERDQNGHSRSVTGLLQWSTKERWQCELSDKLQKCKRIFKIMHINFKKTKSDIPMSYLNAILCIFEHIYIVYLSSQVPLTVENNAYNFVRWLRQREKSDRREFQCQERPSLLLLLNIIY